MSADQRSDSLGQIFNEVGASRRYGNQLVDLGGLMQGARWAYSEGGLVARVVDIPAETAVARGFEVEGGGADVMAEIDRLKLVEHLGNALRWSLLDGGGALIVMAKDGAALDQPLNVNSLQQIEEFRVVSADSIRGNTETYDDPMQTNYGLPITYDVTWRSRVIKVHESRIIEVPGAPISLAAGLDMRNIPWKGRGLSRMVVKAIQRYERGANWAEKLLEKSQQAVHGMEGLAQMLAAKQEEVVRARIDLVDSNRGALNGVAIDSKDTYTITSANLAGVKDAIEQLQIAVAAQSGLPVTILFGRSPGGLNSSGESDWAIVYDMAGQLQRQRLQSAAERAVSLIYAQTDPGTVLEKPDRWQIKWNPPATPTPKEQADIDNKRADTQLKIATALEKLQNTGALSQEEAHAYLVEQGEYGIEGEATEGGAGAAAQYAGQT